MFNLVTNTTDLIEGGEGGYQVGSLLFQRIEDIPL